MRNRVLEIIAAIAGVAFVLYLYADRSGWGISDEPTGQLLPGVEEPAGLISPEPAEPVEPAVAAETFDAPGAVSGPDQATADHDIETATVEWESARAELERVQGQLEQLDAVFDAKEAELAELEAAGTDVEILEEEMLVFLDGIVDQYDELETLLGETQLEELAAAERLAALRGEYPSSADP